MLLLACQCSSSTSSSLSTQGALPSSSAGCSTTAVREWKNLPAAACSATESSGSGASGATFAGLMGCLRGYARCQARAGNCVRESQLGPHRMRVSMRVLSTGAGARTSARVDSLPVRAILAGGEPAPSPSLLTSSGHAPLRFASACPPRPAAASPVVPRGPLTAGNTPYLRDRKRNWEQSAAIRSQRNNPQNGSATASRTSLASGSRMLLTVAAGCEAPQATFTVATALRPNRPG